MILNNIYKNDYFSQINSMIRLGIVEDKIVINTDKDPPEVFNGCVFYEEYFTNEQYVKDFMKECDVIGDSDIREVWTSYRNKLMSSSQILSVRRVDPIQYNYLHIDTKCINCNEPYNSGLLRDSTIHFEYTPYKILVCPHCQKIYCSLECMIGENKNDEKLMLIMRLYEKFVRVTSQEITPIRNLTLLLQNKEFLTYLNIETDKNGFTDKSYKLHNELHKKFRCCKCVNKTDDEK